MFVHFCLFLSLGLTKHPFVFCLSRLLEGKSKQWLHSSTFKDGFMVVFSVFVFERFGWSCFFAFGLYEHSLFMVIRRGVVFGSGSRL